MNEHVERNIDDLRARYIVPAVCEMRRQWVATYRAMGFSEADAERMVTEDASRMHIVNVDLRSRDRVSETDGTE